jgi:Putative transmembrane protein (PGPGW)
MKNNFSKTWKLLPQSLRKTIAFLVGSTLIVTGLLLIILPGPFTLPLVVLGLVVLALEFAWAESLLIRVRQQGKKVNLKKLLRKKSE